ncbi:polysaccharide deacetylase family protein [Candidatus Wolfebacteria bacterium]|nr:polysaccharide deacetylase family protein [Candidatus Wolfebacteria bacterium]
MSLLVVNYHYIDETEEGIYPFSGIYPVSVSRFEKQLEILAQSFCFVGQKDIIDAVKGKNKLPEKSCLITFDDGLLCQYEKALPILDKRNIPAIFFTSGGAYQARKGAIIISHKIHWCMAHLAPNVFLDKINFYHKKFFGEEFNLKKFNIDDEVVRKQYNYGDIETSRLKFILNYLFDERMYKTIIDPMFSELVENEESFFNSFYLSRQQIRELAERSFLGFHGFSHQSFLYLSLEKMDKEITNCQEVFRGIVGDSLIPSSISFPRGGIPMQSYDELKSILVKRGMKLGFTTERSFNLGLEEHFLLARLDANDVPEGKSPLFEIKNGGIEIFNPKLSLARRKFFKEESL